MVIYSTVEIEGATFNKAESDSDVMIRDESDGRKYSSAVYPKSQTRTFSETDEPIDRGDATEEDKDAALRRFGVEV